MMLILLGVSAVSASDNNNVTTDNGDVLTLEEVNDIQSETINEEMGQSNDTVLSANDKTYNDLNNYIANLGPGITFKMDSNYTHNGDGDAGHITISKDVTIDGQNHYINANGEKGIFRITEDGVTLTLKNLILKNGISDNGGVIYTKNNVNINIINCTFTDNEALEDGGAIYFDSTGTLDIKDSAFIKCKTRITDEASRKHNGGAINTQNGVIKLDNCIFKNNTGGFGYGGAIYMNSECSGITNCVFENNIVRSRFGGSIYVDTSNKNGIAIDNCTFTNGTCLVVDKKSGGGGAVYYDGSGLIRLTNSNFTNNVILGEPSDIKTKYENTRATYDSDGGAVYSNHDIEIGNCRFIGNHALDHGGAVYTAEGIRWLDGPSVFINNSAGHANIHIANKGGAIYAGKFLNDAKGHVFINNTCWYGAAIYINNKNEVTFDSCVFRENYAFNYDGKSAPGAAVYIDSASSKIHLINNVIVDNTGNEDRGFYNCGKYGTVEHNWFGSNSPNFNDGYLVEWHRLGSNDKRSDSNYLKLCIVSDTNSVYESNATLTAYFVDCKGNNFTGKLNWWDASFFSDGAFDEFSNLKVGDNKATVIFTPKDALAVHTVSAEVDYQTVSTTINQKGNFTWLQEQIDAATGVYNLTRDLSYSIGMDNIVNGIFIGKEITINGNGHRLNALGQTRIFDVHWSNVKINNITFENGMEIKDGGGAIFIDGVENVTVTNSRFITNRAEEYGGAIYSRNGNHLEISNCEFILNYESSYGGGAVLLSTPNSAIKNSVFKTNKATQGGAIDIRADNVTVDGCVFTNNTAWGSDFGGSAINNFGDNTIVSNSVFLDNKAEARYFDSTIKDDTLILTMYGYNNYMNAIDSSSEINFSNVTYWNGEVTTGDNPLHTNNESGIAVTIEIFDSNGKAIKKVTTKSDKEGLIKFDYSILPDGNYTFRAIHLDDSYYSELYDNGEFSVTKPVIYGSDVTINITDKQEFNHGDCNITFEVENRTDVSYLITDAEGTEIIIDVDTNLSYALIDLPANDEYYSITVINWGNKTVNASSDTRLFKILKTNSNVVINPVDNVLYEQTVNVTFKGDGDSYEIIVFDKDYVIVFSEITEKESVEITNLPVGEYNVTVTNLGSENKTESINSTTFNVLKRDNNIVVSVENVTYGQDAVITVEATADGKYAVDINSTIVEVNVVDGKGAEKVTLGAGDYYANVTFDNPNCNNIAENATFTIKKALSNVQLSLGNVTAGLNTTVVILDDFPVLYNVTIYDSGNNIVSTKLVNSTVFDISPLEVGQYNLTVINLGNENITGSEYSRIIEVTNDNYVSIVVFDADYGREIEIIIVADVDGYYTVDINGTELTMEVVDGFAYNNTLQLPAGEYYANVTYGNPDFNNIIENTTFVIYQAESNLEISDIPDVVYPDDVLIEYSDDYNATFEVVVFDENEDVIYSFKTNATTVLLSDLAAGNYTVMVTNEGDENILGVSEFKNFTVLKATPDVNVTVGNVTYPEDVVVDLISDVSGNYIISLAGESQTVPLKANVAEHISFTINPGVYEFNVVSAESENYTAVNITVPVTVSKADSEFKVKTSTDDKKVNITVNVNPNATGNVEITIAGNKFYAPINDGVAVFTNNYPSGIYVANVTYPGDDYFKSASKNVVFSISEILPILNNTEITLDIDQMYNDVLIVASVNETATGLIQIDIDDETVFLPVNNGVVVYNVLIPAGIYTVTATYLGDYQFNPNTTSKTIDVTDFVKQNTTISAIPAVENETVTLNVNVNSTATGFVEISVDGRKYYVPVEDGEAVFVNDFAPGNYSADITYMGDENFNSATTSAQFEVIGEILKNTPIDLDVVTDDNNISVTVNVDKSATGLVELDINKTKVYLPVNNGTVVFDARIDAGNYTLIATYLGDDQFNANSTSQTFEVIDFVKWNTTISSVPAVNNQTVTLTVTLNSLATGFVEINIAGKKYYVPVEDGKAVFVNEFVAGTYSAAVTYLGDNFFNNATDSAQFTVIEYNATLQDSPIDLAISVENDTATIEVNVNVSASGLVEFNIDGNAVYMAVENGKAVLTQKLTDGEHEITVTYLGDNKFNANSTSDKFNTSGYHEEILTATVISDITVADGKLTAALKDTNGNLVSGAKIKYSVDGVENTIVTDSNGLFSIDMVYDAKIVFSYEGNGTLDAVNTTLIIASSEVPVSKVASKFNVTAGTEIKTYAVDFNVGERGKTVAFKLTDADGNPIVNATVEFAYKTVYFNRTTDENGIVSIGISTQLAGEYLCALSYLGDDKHNATFVAFYFNIQKKPITITAKAKTYKVATKTKKYTVTLKTKVCSSKNGKIYLKSGKKVTLKVNGKTFTAKINSKGKATFKITNLKKKGKFTAVIKFAGDKTYKAASKKVKITVK